MLESVGNIFGEDYEPSIFDQEQTPLSWLECSGCGRKWLTAEAKCPYCKSELGNPVQGQGQSRIARER